MHKKYTYKKGKKFGPYYYETKRVNGKVVTTYLGKDYKPPRKSVREPRFFVSLFVFVLILAGLFGFVYYQSFFADQEIEGLDLYDRFSGFFTGFSVEGDDSSGDSDSDSGGDSDSGDSESSDSGGDDSDSDDSSDSDSESESESGSSGESEDASEDSSDEEESGDSEEESEEGEENESEIEGEDSEEEIDEGEQDQDSEEQDVDDASGGLGSEDGEEGIDEPEEDEEEPDTEKDVILDSNETDNSVNNETSDSIDGDTNETSDEEPDEPDQTQDVISNESMVDAVLDTQIVVNEVREENVSVDVVQYGAVLGTPVKWTKKIEVNNSANLIVEIPAHAVNVSVRKINETSVEEFVLNEETGDLEASEDREEGEADGDIVEEDEEEPDTGEDVILDSNETSIDDGGDVSSDSNDSDDGIDIDGNETDDEDGSDNDETSDEDIHEQDIGEEDDGLGEDGEEEESADNEADSEEEASGDDNGEQDDEETEDTEASGDDAHEESGEEPEESEDNQEEDEGAPEVTIGITGDVVFEQSGGFSLFDWFKSLLGITGLVVQESNESIQEISVALTGEEESVEIEYYTDPPVAVEEELERGKKVRISSPEGVHYENVLAFTEFPESLHVKDVEKISIYWEENNTVIAPTAVLDNDDNGIYDYVEWVAPHLSNQTFNIIVIIEAEHLDENRTFISDIYDDVKELDGNWSETIPDGHYVRVVFERNLTSDRDITVWPRGANGTDIGDVVIEIYEVNGSVVLVEFENLTENAYNKVYLDGLVGEQDTFDLLILGGDVEFDHIIDPTQEFFEDCTNIGDWTVTGGWSAVLFCQSTDTADQNMTSANIDLTGENNVNLSFTYSLGNTDVTANFKVYFYGEGESSIDFQEVFSDSGAQSSTNVEIALEDTLVAFTTGHKIRGECYGTGAGRSASMDCTWDNINVTSHDYPVLDTTDPAVSFVDPTPADASTQSGDSIFVNVSSSDADSVDHYAFTDFNSDLLLWMRMDDVNGSDDPVDLSAYSHNGSLFGNALINETGYWGNGSHYDGKQDAIQMGPDNDDLIISDGSNYTISAWLNMRETSKAQGVFGGMSSSSRNNFAYSIYVNGGHIRCLIGNSTNNDNRIVVSSASADTWYHIACSWNGTTHVVYSNGNEVATEVPSLTGTLPQRGAAGTIRNLIGIEFSPTNANTGFNGTIDDVMTFNRTLDATEIAALYNATATQYQHNFTDLSIGTHTFTGHAVDKAGNKNDTGERSVTVDSSLDSVDPAIAFVDPTPADASIQSNTDIYVNLSSSDLNDNMVSGQDHYAFTDFNNDVVLWMRMDDVNDSGDPTDISSYSNNGTLNGNALINETGYWGNASHYDGTGDYVEVAHNGSLNFDSGSFTASFWIRFPAAASNQRFFLAKKSGVAASGEGWVIYHQADGDLTLMMADGTTRLWTRDNVGDSIDDGEWHHVVFVVDGRDGIREYFDGASQSPTINEGPLSSIGSVNNSLVLRAGSRSDGGTMFNGTIDDILLFNRNLSAGEVSALYNATATQYQYNFTGLADGTHTFTGYAVDKLGNKNQTGERQVTVDNQQPAIQFVDPTPANASIQSNTDIYVNLSTSDTLSVGHYAFIDFDNDNVLWFEFDERNATGEPTDLSSYSNNASLANNALINSSGYWGDGLFLDGTNDYGAVIYDDSINLTTNWTISFWANPTATGSGQFFLAKALAADYDWGIYRASGGTLSIFYDGGSEAAGYAIPQGVWTHIVVSQNDTNLVWYVNNSRTIESSAPVSGGKNHDLYLGGRWSGSTLAFDYPGYLDTVLIWNRTLDDGEVAALYNATATQYQNNFTDLSIGTHTFTGHAVDKTGNRNQTEERQVTIDHAPTTPTPEINSTDASNRTAQDLHGFDTLLDEDAGDFLNVSIRWFNNSVLHLVQDYNNSYANGTLFVADLDSGNTTKWENWTFSMRVYDGNTYTNWVNSSDLEILNTPPGTPTLSSPADGSQTTDRTPTFSWTTGGDGDGDTLTYELNATSISASTCVDKRHITSIAGTSHEVIGDLLCLIDNGDQYNWSTRAYDGEDYSSWTDFWRLNISAYVDVTLLNDSVAFGTIRLDQSNDTVDSLPLPFLLQNNGTVFVNVTISATQLWNTQGSASEYYQFKTANYTLENGSFDWGLSVTDYTNMPISSSSLAIALLNYTNATDTAEIDINVSVPPDEGAGERSSIVTFTASLAEG